MAREILRRPLPATAWPDDFQRIVTQFFADSEAPLRGSFAPALDVEETQDNFTLHVEVPGVKPEDVDVSIEESVLTVAGSRNFYEDKTAEGLGDSRLERRALKSYNCWHERAFRSLWPEDVRHLRTPTIREV